MRYFHLLRLDTKQKLELRCRKTVLEIVQDFPENVETLATLLQIKNKKAIDINSFGIPSESEIRILFEDVLKTKSQLTDIWNKAHKNKKLK